MTAPAKNSPPLLIRLAAASDLPALESMARRVVTALRQQGIEQWDEIYPAASDFAADIRDQTLFVASLQLTASHDSSSCDSSEGSITGPIMGAICLNEVELPGYETAAWQAETFLVVHRLLVDPASQGQKIGSRLLQFAEQQTQKQQKQSLRLDCFQAHSIANACYLRLGYLPRGEADYRKGRFILYEKIFESPIHQKRVPLGTQKGIPEVPLLSESEE